MSYQFTLQVTRVECLNEQVMEWGKDEMRIFGFGVSRKGHLFSTGYRSLGSYGEGDVKTTTPLPQTLFERELEHDGTEVIFYFWFVEEDGGGVRDAAAALEAEFRAAYFEQARLLNEARFPRDCIPFTAFYKAVLPFEDSLQEAATEGRNDEVYFPVDLLLRFEPDGPSALNVTRDLQVRRSKRLGDYLVNFRTTYRLQPEVLA